MLFKLRKKLKRVLSGDTRVAVCEQHKLLYVRIPKSGNSSVLAAIPGFNERRMSSAKIAQLDDSWTSFSFVRNPWSRLVSTYNQKASSEATSKRLVDGVYEGFIDQGIPIRPGMSFEEFCEVVCDIPDSQTDKHLQSQAYTLIRQNKPIVPIIGKMEHMGEDWNKIMDKVGLNYELPHRNRTEKKADHYSHYYSNEALVQKVADRYCEDIKYFDYDFERR